MSTERIMRGSPVVRITVDERLSDDLIRVLVAPLKRNGPEFRDDPDDWGEEKELILDPATYRSGMGLRGPAPKDWAWDQLQEGQVFLLGGVRIDRRKGRLAQFRQDRRHWRLQRIDPLIRDRVKMDYLTALERSADRAEKDYTQ